MLKATRQIAYRSASTKTNLTALQILIRFNMTCTYLEVYATEELFDGLNPLLIQIIKRLPINV